LRDSGSLIEMLNLLHTGQSVVSTLSDKTEVDVHARPDFYTQSIFPPMTSFFLQKHDPKKSSCDAEFFKSDVYDMCYNSI